MLPDDLLEWLGFGFTAISGIVGTALALLRAGRLAGKTESKFSEHGKRLGGLESQVVSHSSSIHELRMKDQAHEFKMLEISNGLGTLTGRVTELVSSIERQGERKSDHEIKVEARLARIEERLDIFLRLQDQQRI